MKNALDHSSSDSLVPSVSSRRSGRRQVGLVTGLLLGASILLGEPARAIEVVWVGAGVTANWTNANNWLGFNRPNNDGLDSVQFYDETARTTSVINQSYWIKEISIFESANNPAALTFNSSSNVLLSIDSGIFSEVTTAQTFNVSIKATNNITIDNDEPGVTGGNMVFNNEIDTNGKTIWLIPSTGGLTFNNSITGGGRLYAKGSGTVYLNAANSFTGGIIIEKGTVQIPGGSSLGSTGANLTFSPTSVTDNPTLMRTSTGTISLPIKLIGQGEGRVGASAGATVTLSNNLVGAADFGKTGAGTVVLTQSTSSYGNTNVREGTLRLTTTNATSRNELFVASGATLALDPGITNQVSKLNGRGTIQLGLGSGLYIGELENGPAFDGSGFFSGSVTGVNGTFYKRGDGMLVLTGSSSYSGSTVVSDGTVVVNNPASTSATGSSAVTVSGGVLAGDGAITGSVDVWSTGTIAPSAISTPADGVGSLDTGTLTLSQGARTIIEYTSDKSDFIAVTGNATLNGTLDLRNVGLQAGFSARQIMSISGTRTGVFSSIVGMIQSPTESLAVTYTNSGVNLTLARLGDANIDGSVNFDDLLALAQSYGVASGATWSTGDFDGNGSVLFDDLLKLAQQYGTSPRSANQSSRLDSGFASDWALAQALVPEPMSLTSLLLLAAAGVRSRK